MRLQRRFHVLLWTILLLAASSSCTSGQDTPIPLASFTENYVNVSISLEHLSNSDYVLLVTFTPPEGYHLYSKDIPEKGLAGLGRPTLLELTSSSQMKATGRLIESVKPQSPDFEPKELMVYPAGAVTLCLPVELPAGNQWIDDELSITYMACSSSQCKPPVVGKIVQVRIPGADLNETR